MGTPFGTRVSVEFHQESLFLGPSLFNRVYWNIEAFSTSSNLKDWVQNVFFSKWTPETPWTMISWTLISPTWTTHVLRLIVYDLFGGEVPLLLERFSEQLKSQVKEVQSTTDALNEKFRTRRDEFLKEQGNNFRRKLKQKHVVLMRDKLIFVFGVSQVIVTTFVFSGYPQWLTVYYVALILPMLTYRYYYYRSINYHYFMADLCYFVNALLVISTFFFPFSETLWKISFVLSNGPVAWAIYLWKNSLVFHSLDKIISVIIHIMPPLVLLLIGYIYN